MEEEQAFNGRDLFYARRESFRSKNKSFTDAMIKSWSQQRQDDIVLYDQAAYKANMCHNLEDGVRILVSISYYLDFTRIKSPKLISPSSSLSRLFQFIPKQEWQRGL